MVQMRTLGPQQGEIVAQLLARLALSLQQHHVIGTPGQGLQTQSTGAGKQIQAAGARQARCEPVKQRLADAIPGRAQAAGGGEV